MLIYFLEGKSVKNTVFQKFNKINLYKKMSPKGRKIFQCQQWKIQEKSSTMNQSVIAGDQSDVDAPQRSAVRIRSNLEPNDKNEDTEHACFNMKEVHDAAQHWSETQTQSHSQKGNLQRTREVVSRRRCHLAILARSYYCWRWNQ